MNIKRHTTQRLKALTDKKNFGLFCAFTVITWLFFDFFSMVSSVLPAYFYFSSGQGLIWYGWVGIIIIIAFGGPIAYGSLFYKREQTYEIHLFLGLQLLIYFLLVLIKQSDLFAWLTVLGTCISGMALLSIFKKMHHFEHALTPLMGFMTGISFYHFSRVLNYGMIALILESYLAIVIMAILAVLTFMNLSLTEMTQVEEENTHWLNHKYGIAFGLLLVMSLGLIYNLQLWSAENPMTNSWVYVYTFLVGSLMGVTFVQKHSYSLQGLFSLYLMGLSGVAMAITFIMYLNFSFITGLFVHGTGCVSLTILWGLFMRRYYRFTTQHPGQLPITGLQIGFYTFITLSLFHINSASPAVYYFALVFTVWVMGSTDMEDFFSAKQVIKVKWYHGAACAALVVFLPLFLYWKTLPSYPLKELEKPPNAPLSLISTNIRYGWTDDTRFEPWHHARLLKQLKADLIGFQEVNRGYPATGFMDLFQYYQTYIPGQWIFGNGDPGFGNALMSRFPILDTEVKMFADRELFERSCLWSLIDLDGTEVEVFVTHFSHFNDKDNPVRNKQAQIMTEWLKKTKRPWILLGDLNASPDAPELKGIFELAHPVFTSNPELFKAQTFASPGYEVWIDYVLFSPDFQLIKQEVIENQGSSDHKPVRSIVQLIKETETEKPSPPTNSEKSPQS